MERSAYFLFFGDHCELDLIKTVFVVGPVSTLQFYSLLEL